MNERIFYSEYFYEKGSKETDVLEKNAKEYPYSSLATFMLLYHYKKIAHPGFENLAKKTAVLFNNPHWLQFQLYNKSSLNTTAEIINPDNFRKEKEIPSELENNLPLEFSSQQNPVQDSGEKEYVPTHEIITETNSEENKEQEKEIKESSDEILSGNSFQQEEPDTNENAANDAIQIEEIIKDSNESTPETISENSVGVNTERGDEIIAFEPLHTVDYFASQGIKINEELLANDKLGSQMKSFTAWLKSMKKLHPGKLEEQSLATEKLIQTAADESNINTEILTEAMAEVLIKQNKKEKAIEMFSKLSLINPSKSAYFAARIESIKSN